ncbi:aromatic-ring-hydroxylating dioxygenase subunit beta [Mesorhizobium sp. CA8]|uniref:aromatic-ring-hydroxylating dioxygenase subunit beta n=1 Tax=unclassified Mesorhizobium TaxID=325217 RepID=UPI001CCABCEE|nr:MULTISPECIES: aromatic-ring-hydroxylating dioxygenase subunit beta [unclassified Mesorhizobium]MBZ9761674.1 aromatic-ring-hydroxylating dioxygenase subunit beta [Mesorhizobium sp. CA8]MBZ9820572.1 aromatic-ring-hydroxylating dioxygenase subunit beta [Mesorhizobium sp. CA4]
MFDASARETVAAVLYREALCLDRQDWDAWLALYCDDVEYWIPAWKSEHSPTGDPASEGSLIYHTSRNSLAERIMRIRSRKSVTAMPLPRTTHLTSNILVEAQSETTIEANSVWQVHVYDPRTARQYTHFGRVEHRLRKEADGQWRIARKKTILVNDRVPTVIDFYTL